MDPDIKWRRLTLRGVIFSIGRQKYPNDEAWETLTPQTKHLTLVRIQKKMKLVQKGEFVEFRTQYRIEILMVPPNNV